MRSSCFTTKELHCRRNSIDVKKRRHIVRTGSCLTSVSALSTSVRTRLKMFTDWSSVNEWKLPLVVIQICSFPLRCRHVKGLQLSRCPRSDQRQQNLNSDFSSDQGIVESLYPTAKYCSSVTSCRRTVDRSMRQDFKSDNNWIKRSLHLSCSTVKRPWCRTIQELWHYRE